MTVPKHAWPGRRARVDCPGLPEPRTGGPQTPPRCTTRGSPVPPRTQPHLGKVADADRGDIAIDLGVLVGLRVLEARQNCGTGVPGVSILVCHPRPWNSQGLRLVCTAIRMFIAKSIRQN